MDDDERRWRTVHGVAAVVVALGAVAAAVPPAMFALFFWFIGGWNRAAAAEMAPFAAPVLCNLAAVALLVAGRDRLAAAAIGLATALLALLALRLGDAAWPWPLAFLTAGLALLTPWWTRR